MMPVELTEAFLAQIAGWEAMKQARATLQTGAVLSSNWTAPLLRGVVQEGSTSYRAGLVIKSTIEIENVCHCRQSREWGTICAHSVAVGLHHLKRGQPQTAPQPAQTITAKSVAPKPLQRLQRAESEQGEPMELFVILPPNLAQAMDKGKVMLCFEAKWKNGRTPLSSLPRTVPFQMSAADSELLDALEKISPTEIPAMMMLDAPAFADLLPVMAEHPRITIGKSQPVRVGREPFRLKLRAALEKSGEIVLALNEKNPAAKVL